MANICIENPLDSLIRASSIDQPAKKEADKNNGEAIYTLVFMLLVDAMNIRQNTVVVQSKNLMANAAEQSRLNKEVAGIQFSQIPNGNVGQNTINQVMAHNQQYSKEREDIQNDIILARNDAQVQMTDTNTSVGQVQQDGAQNTGWLETEGTIGQQIVQMTSKK